MATTLEAPARDTVTARRSITNLIYRPEFSVLIGFIAIYVFFLVTTQPVFHSLAGTSTWVDPAAELGIVSIPVGFLMIAGEFDLSVGSVVAFSSMFLAAWVGYFHYNIWLGLVIDVVLAALVGLTNGILVTRTKLPSFIVTLGTQLLLTGITLGGSTVITGSSSIDMTATAPVRALFSSNWNQFNVSILWLAGIAVLGHHILTNTRTGNWITAIGGDIETANRAGVQTARVRIGLFISTSTAAALVGIIQAVEYNGSAASNGQVFVFNAIIAAVIGGVLLTGGFGTIIGVVLGAMTYQLVTQGIYFTGWDTDWSNALIGGLLLLAVLSNNWFRKATIARGVKKGS
ncbi:MAG: ABC transporter permease [Actinomycetales bacterium]|nr:ABC transporter permease [Actinomycetales bacterium]